MPMTQMGAHRISLCEVAANLLNKELGLAVGVCAGANLEVNILH